MKPETIIRRIEKHAAKRPTDKIQHTVEHAELQLQLCAARISEAAERGDEAAQLKWSALANEWEKRKGVAVKERNADLLPKVLERLQQYQDAERQFAALAQQH